MQGVETPHWQYGQRLAQSVAACTARSAVTTISMALLVRAVGLLCSATRAVLTPSSRSARIAGQTPVLIAREGVIQASVRYHL